MDGNHIKSMFKGIDQFTKDIILTKCKQQLAKSINAVNHKINNDIQSLLPRPELILNAFRLCSLETVRIVILGCDKQPTTGLCFSSHIKTIAVMNIYKCLHNYGLIKSIPDHGDLAAWARLGILLLNSSLTSAGDDSHGDCWNDYIDALMCEISLLPQKIIFILLGDTARKTAKLLDQRRHMICEWDCPSSDVITSNISNCTT